jgi:hypothetical protein
MVLAAIGVCMAGCQPSTDSVAQETKVLLQSKFDSDPDLKPFHLKVSNLDVIHEDGTRYRGIANVAMDGTNHSIVLRILDDGHKLMYETDPGAFAFTAQHALSALNAEWSQVQQSTFTAGCVASIVDKARTDYVATAARHGQIGDDFPEDRIRGPITQLCSCVSKEIAKRGSFEEFELNAESHTGAIMDEVFHRGLCNAKGILNQMIEPPARAAPDAPPVPEAPAPVQKLIDQEDELNDRCRGGSGDDPNTLVVCDRRDQLYQQIKAKGWCWGHDLQIEVDKQWEPCQLDAPSPDKADKQ